MTATHAPDSSYAWFRLMISLLLATIGGIGIWSCVIILPYIQQEFGVDRAGASLPYTVTTIGFALGGVMGGRLADRYGITVPLVIAAVGLGAGLALGAMSQSYFQFLVIQALIVGFIGCSATFGPLVADVSQWFLKRRGMAVAIVASGNYVAGTIWPPILEGAASAYGWRTAFVALGVFCVVTMLPLAMLLRQRPRFDDRASPAAGNAKGLLPASPLLYPALVIAGLACCVAMSMPQVHIVAYCADLGYGPAVGATMLSMMLGFGVVSRLLSGYFSDYLGGAGTLIIGSVLQALALLFYIPFDGLVPLYVVSAIFGLAQGGIVPSYALIIRDHYPAREAGFRISMVFTSTVLGMALGGWMSGEIFDYTGSYTAAFLNGFLWNLLNMSVAAWVLWGRLKNRRPPLQPVAA